MSHLPPHHSDLYHNGPPRYINEDGPVARRHPQMRKLLERPSPPSHQKQSKRTSRKSQYRHPALLGVHNHPRKHPISQRPSKRRFSRWHRGQPRQLPLLLTLLLRRSENLPDALFGARVVHPLRQNFSKHNQGGSSTLETFFSRSQLSNSSESSRNTVMSSTARLLPIRRV